MTQINRVLIVGGTHGNEWTGIYLIQKFQHCADLIHRSSFETLTLLANPLAFQQGKRYVDRDLNRAFHIQDLQNDSQADYESRRSREIVQQFGQQGKTPVDFVIDLHTTTANMGLTLIVDDHSFNLGLAAYVQSVQPEVYIYCLSRSLEDTSGLPSICDLNCTIEVGAVPQNVRNAQYFQATEKLVSIILDYLEQVNLKFSAGWSSQITVYQHDGVIDYPRDEAGHLTAMIHPKLQFQDYQALHPGDPLFLGFNGEVISYQGEAIVYPVFINEAAYYEKSIALCLTQKRQVELLTA